MSAASADSKSGTSVPAKNIGADSKSGTSIPAKKTGAAKCGYVGCHHNSIPKSEWCAAHDAMCKYFYTDPTCKGLYAECGGKALPGSDRCHKHKTRCTHSASVKCPRNHNALPGYDYCDPVAGSEVMEADSKSANWKPKPEPILTKEAKAKLHAVLNRFKYAAHGMPSPLIKMKPTTADICSLCKIRVKGKCFVCKTNSIQTGSKYYCVVCKPNTDKSELLPTGYCDWKLLGGDMCKLQTEHVDDCHSRYCKAHGKEYDRLCDLDDTDDTAAAMLCPSREAENLKAQKVAEIRKERRTANAALCPLCRPRAKGKCFVCKKNSIQAGSKYYCAECKPKVDKPELLPYGCCDWELPSGNMCELPTALVDQGYEQHNHCRYCEAHGKEYDRLCSLADDDNVCDTAAAPPTDTVADTQKEKDRIIAELPDDVLDNINELFTEDEEQAKTKFEQSRLLSIIEAMDPLHAKLALFTLCSRPENFRQPPEDTSIVLRDYELFADSATVQKLFMQTLSLRRVNELARSAADAGTE